MAESKTIRGEQRWFLIALGVIVLLGLLYFGLGLDPEPADNIETPAAETPPVSP